MMHMGSHRGIFLKALGGCALIASSGSAASQTVQQPIPPADLGNVVSAASETTVFRISELTGAVTPIGTGSRVSTGSARAMVTIACNSTRCSNNNTMTVRIASTGAQTGRAGKVGNFKVASGTGQVSGATGTDPLTFTLAAIPNPGSANFWLGMDVPIHASGATGNASSGFTVSVTSNANNNSPTDTAPGSAVAKVFRPIELSNTSPLAFGRVIRPSSGNGTVVIDAAGNRSFTGSVTTALATPASSAANFTVKGEGGQSFSLNIPSSFQLTRSGTSIPVTLTSSTPAGSRLLSSALGSEGTLSFTVGGSIPLTSETQTGTYQGTFMITVQYN
jgi:hypothetical protein